MNFLKEILNMTALPFNWLDDKRCQFTIQNKQIGIFIEFVDINLTTRHVSCANVVFGEIINDKFEDETSLSLTLTGLGKPRTVFSTVAEACIANINIINSDIICIASTDDVKETRNLLYSLMFSEIKEKIIKFKNAKIINMMSETGNYLVLLTNLDFSREEITLINSQLGLKKLS